MPAAVILSPASAADAKTKPIGTGPFKFDKWSKGTSVELVRNPNYWGTPVKLDKAVFKIIGDAQASFAAMMAGDVDAFTIYPAPETLDQFRADPRFKVVVGNTEGKTIMAMNNGRKPFDDIRVRQAMSMAVDRKSVIDGAMYGIGKPIGSHFAPQDPGYVDLTGKYPFDPAKAKDLLKQAGVAEGTKLKMALPPPEYARRSGEIIAAQLKKVGIEVEIVPMEWAQWLSDVFKAKNYDLTVISHVEPLDLDIYARDDYYFDYKNPAYKALMRRAFHDLRPVEAAGALRQGTADAGGRRGQRLPVPAAEERRVERQAEGSLGQRADPRERPHGGFVGRVQGSPGAPRSSGSPLPPGWRRGRGTGAVRNGLLRGRLASPSLHGAPAPGSPSRPAAPVAGDDGGSARDRRQAASRRHAGPCFSTRSAGSTIPSRRAASRSASRRAPESLAPS